MNYLSTLLVFLAPCYVVFGQQGPCELPLSGGLGHCKSIFKCQSLLSLANQAKKTLQEKDLLYKSHCGIDDDEPAVCCPKQNETQQCITPEGKLGECISVYSCPQFKTLLRQPLTDDIRKFVQTSQCDGTAQYSICCGPIPSFDVKKVNCELTAFPPDPKTGCCGVDSSFKNEIPVLEGDATEIDQYPWLARIEYSQGHRLRVMCGATLISGKYVLTVAHCVTGSDIKIKIPKNVILGEYDESNEGPDCKMTIGGGKDCSDGAIRIPIEKIVPHPQYLYKTNDIALVRMTKMAPYTAFIRPICLPTSDVTMMKYPIYPFKFATWGTASKRSPVLLQVSLPFVSREKCQEVHTSLNASVWYRKLCAGGEEGKGACRDDVGLPLMNKDGAKYEVIGLVSIGSFPCGQKRVTALCTNVYEYNSWIKSNIEA